MPLFFLAAFLSFFLSFAARIMAEAWLMERVALWGSILGLERSANPGIAFGLRLPAGVQEAAILVALCCVAWLALRAKTAAARGGYGLIVGGALGNIVDRLGDGAVTDFFQAGSFPLFNVADACITTGVLLLLAESFHLISNRH